MIVVILINTYIVVTITILKSAKFLKTNSFKRMFKNRPTSILNSEYSILFWMTWWPSTRLPRHCTTKFGALPETVSIQQSNFLHDYQVQDCQDNLEQNLELGHQLARFNNETCLVTTKYKTSWTLYNLIWS